MNNKIVRKRDIFITFQSSYDTRIFFKITKDIYAKLRKMDHNVIKGDIMRSFQRNKNSVIASLLLYKIKVRRWKTSLISCSRSKVIKSSQEWYLSRSWSTQQCSVTSLNIIAWINGHFLLKIGHKTSLYCFEKNKTKTKQCISWKEYNILNQT